MQKGIWRQTALTAVGTSLLFTSNALAGELSGDLATLLDNTPADESVSTLVYLNHQFDATGATAMFNAEDASNRARNREVIETLMDLADVTQVDILQSLNNMQKTGNVDSFQTYWITNAIRVDASPAAIRALAARKDVDMVHVNYPIESVTPVDGDDIFEKDNGGAAAGGPENGVDAVRAPEAWALGYDGTGVLVSIIDTGTDGNHPALAARWRGLDPGYAANPEWAFHDPFLENHDFPYDGGSHGTHVMGSVLGGAPGDQVGVAPGAQWISSASIDRGGGIPQTVADAMLSFQWIVNPDGNPGTFFDVPATCSNSWGLTSGHGYPSCDESFWSFIDNAEAAGVAVFFAAGNEGFSGLRRPGDRATDEYHTVAVAAVNANVGGWPIAGFSSRGPTFCTPSGDAAIKPDIAAPGDGVRSSVPGGGYSSFSGTSMAAPHINGVAALVRQACPDLTVDEVKQILYDTAVDLGSVGKDNDYGNGMVDAYEAVLLAESLCGPSPPRAQDAAYITGVETNVDITLIATDHDGEPGGPIQIRIKSLPTDGNMLVDAGNGYTILPGDLPYDLDSFGNVVTFVPATGYWGDNAFTFCGDDGGSPPDAGEGEAATIGVQVQFDAPVITDSMLPDGYLNNSYGSYQVNVSQGQPELSFSVVSNEYVEDDLGSSMYMTGGVAQGWNADDGSWNYALPFTFNYYGVDYNSVNVCSNGFIDFTSTSADYSNSSSEMISATRICPMWDDLRTDSGGDIYIDNKGDNVTIRWDTVTYSSGNPCEHAVTLYDDGRIEFHYGPGNSPVTPTIGVSSGDGTNYTFSMYDGDSGLGNVNSVAIFPPSGMPEGMFMDEDGIVQGTPTEFGSFSPRVRVVDSLGRSDSKELSLDILEGDPPCSADFNNSGNVDTEDLLQLISAWGDCVGCDEDITGDDKVDTEDLLEFLGQWGDC